MIKKRDIVITGLQNFNISIGSNCVNIAKEFAKNNRVLYVNYPLDRITSLRHSSNPIIKKQLSIIKKKSPALSKVGKNLWVLDTPIILESINKIKFNSLFDFFNKINNKRFADSINHNIQELNFTNIILFVDGDIYRSFFLKELLKPKTFVYYSRDRLTSTKYYQHHGKRLEAKLLNKADLVCCNSEYLANLARKYNSNSKNVGQGCNVDLFTPKKHYIKPKDILNIKSPIIGYAGSLKASRLDIKLLEDIAIAKPKWNFVFVGPEDHDFTLSSLHKLPNVFFTGLKPIDELPDYIAFFDVAINPQYVNDITIGNYPLKIDEYLAMGKKIVATKTDTMKLFSNYVYLASNTTEYIYGHY